jgi:hypothetical protein
MFTHKFVYDRAPATVLAIKPSTDTPTVEMLSTASVSMRYQCAGSIDYGTKSNTCH